MNQNSLSQLKELEYQIKQCTKCQLSEFRKNVVVSNGVYNSDIMIIGEAPGFNEDVKGLPFVGQAGKLLQKMLSNIGLSYESVYITNVVKCRPPENRDPLQEEINVCKPYLMKQIELIDPKLIILLGKYSVSNVLGINLKISYLKGRVFIKEGRYIFCTYHPAFVLRNYSSFIDEYTYHFEKIGKIIKKIRENR